MCCHYQPNPPQAFIISSIELFDRKIDFLSYRYRMVSKIFWGLKKIIFLGVHVLSYS